MPTYRELQDTGLLSAEYSITTGWVGQTLNAYLSPFLDAYNVSGSSFPSDTLTNCNVSKDRFIAGHILRQKFGGEGVVKNLVPLTPSANSTHAGKETQIDRLISTARRKTEEIHRQNLSATEFYLVHYKVSISNTTYRVPGYSANIPASLTCSGTLMKSRLDAENVIGSAEVVEDDNNYSNEYVNNQ